jgi:ribonucleoside-triphosphate reductase
MEATAQTQAMAKCPHCGSQKVYGMSRVVGYFSKIENWNGSKRAEFRHRQRGTYGI